MKPKFTRVLSISADNDLKAHMEALSEDADDVGVDTDIYRDGYQDGAHRYPTAHDFAMLADIERGKMPSPRTEAQVIAKNLEVTTAAGDAVNLPHHYARFKIEPIRFIEENKLPFLPGNVIKYVTRYDAKNGIEDLRKARRCLDMMIAQLEGDPDWWKRRDG